MNKLYYFGCIMVLLIIGVWFTARPGLANPFPDIGVSYIVRIEKTLLHVDVELDQVHSERLYFVFAESCTGVRELSKRIRHMEVRDRQNGQTLPFKSIGKGLYEIQTAGTSGIDISYDLNPQAVAHNHNLTTLTSSYLHISGEDFLTGVFRRRQDVTNFDKLSFNKCRLKFTHLPPHWKTLTTYPVTKEGWILVDNLNEVLLHAGDYQTVSEKINGSLYTMAFDRELKFDSTTMSKDMQKIIGYYNRIFHQTPDPQELIVINQGRRESPFGPLWGGQSKRANVIIEIAGITTKNQNQYRRELAWLPGHEIFHLWLASAFNVRENFDWFWEGFTEYQTWRSLRKVGIIDRDEFNAQFARKFYKYQNLKLKSKMSVVAASKHKFGFNPEYSSLIYDKGTLIAYLYDQKLSQAGKDYHQFLAALYQRYAIPQKPLGNREVIAFMDQYLGDATFTRDYVLGTKALPLSPWKEFGMGYVKAWFNFTSPPPFPFNILIPLAVLGLVGWLIFKTVGRRKTA